MVTIYSLFLDLPDDMGTVWSQLTSTKLLDMNKRNTSDLVGTHPLNSSSGSDSDSDFKDIPFPQDDVMQQVGMDFILRYIPLPVVVFMFTSSVSEYDLLHIICIHIVVSYHMYTYHIVMSYVYLSYCHIICIHLILSYHMYTYHIVISYVYILSIAVCHTIYRLLKIL